MLPMLKTVISSLFQKEATLLYPLERKEPPLGFRGHVINNHETCILCGICQKKCPTGALTVDRAGKTWAIAQFDCIQCGHCVDVCPKDSLEMSAERPAVVTEKVVHTVHLS